MRTIPLLAVMGLFLVSCGKKEEAATELPETLVSKYQQDEMDEAIATARAKTDEFLKVLGEGDADSFSVKAPITDENGTEHFWLTDVSYKDGVFTGLVGNEPGIVKTVTFGQEWIVKEEEISDWMYTRGEKIHGGFTIEPLLDSSPDGEAMRERLVR